MNKKNFFFLFQQIIHLHIKLTEKLRKCKMDYNKTNSQQDQVYKVTKTCDIRDNKTE